MKLSLFIVLSLSILLLLPNVFALSTTGSVDWNTNVGQIRSDFYGANTHGWFLGTQTEIDTNNDGNRETQGNITWHREKWLDSGMDYQRADMSLGSYYSNTSDISGVNMSNTNISRHIQNVNFSYQNGQKVLYIVDFMPIWLADNSSGYCSNLQYCPASNWTKFTNIVLDFINRTTNGGQWNSSMEIEVWNEPDCGFWMGNLACDNPLKFSSYTQLYNNTYNAIKSIYPNMPVGGFASTSVRTYGNFTKYFISNFTNKFDFFSLHTYSNNLNNTFDAQIGVILGNCTLYGANCNRIVYSEYNSQSQAYLNSTNESKINIAGAYNYLLNKYPANITSVIYQWAELYNFNNSVYYPAYPLKYHMVSEPKLDNELTSIYNITKLFANNHKALNYVVTSSVADSTIKIVASKDSNGQKYITLTNTNTSAFNVTLSGMTSGLKDVETGAIYPNNAGTVVINDLASYGVQTLTSTSYPQISFVSPTPSNGSTVNTRNVIINATIDTENPLSSIIYNWNNTNTILNYSNLIGCFNFNNISSLGESDAKVVNNCGTTNATVRNGLNYNSNLGRYDGGFNFTGANYSTGAVRDLNISPALITNETNNWTISIWIKPYNTTQNGGIFFTLFRYSHLKWNKATPYINFNLNNGTDQFINTASNTAPEGVWTNVIVKRAGSDYRVYINGDLAGNKTITGLPDFSDTKYHQIGASEKFSASEYFQFNGSIDDLTIWNTTLTDSEIKELSKTTIIKNNQTNYNSITNYSIYGLTNNNIQLDIRDNGNNQNTTQTSLRFLTHINLTSIFIKYIPYNFYGTNLGTDRGTGENSIRWLAGDGVSYGTKIDTDNNGIQESYSNVSYNRQIFSNTKNKIARADIKLDSLYSNQTTRTNGVNFTGNLTGDLETLALANSQNFTIMYIVSYMPSWLADNSSGNCNTLTRCPANNYTIWNNILIDFLNRTIGTNPNYVDNVMFEIWNEPDINFWLDKLVDDHINKSVSYHILYNNSYQTIKAYNSSLLVGGPAVARITSLNTTTNFIKNFTNEYDFFSFHRYTNDFTNRLQQDYDLIVSLGVTKPIYVTEYNMNKPEMQNNSANNTRVLNILAWNYADTLNYASLNISLVQFQFSEPWKYGQYYGTYPSLYAMYSEPNLDNTFYPPYNVTYNYARYAPAGGIVYYLTIDNSEFTATWTKEITTNKYSLTVTNKINDKQNITLNCNTFTGNLIDVSSGELYSCASGSVNLGVTDEYEVRYLTEPVITYIPNYKVYSNYLGEQLKIESSVHLPGDTCDSATSVVLIALQLLIALGLLAVPIGMFYAVRQGIMPVNAKTLILGFVTLSISLALFGSLLDNIGSLC